MLDLKKEFNIIFSEFVFNDYFPVYFAEPTGTSGKCISWEKKYTGVSMQVCLYHFRLAEQGSLGRILSFNLKKKKVSTTDTASIIKSHIPLPRLGLNHSCCIAV